MTRLLIFYAKPKLTTQTTGPRSDHNGQKSNIPRDHSLLANIREGDKGFKGVGNVGIPVQFDA